MSAADAPDDTLLWPIDRVFLLGFAPAGLAAAASLVAAFLLDRAGPDARELILHLALAAQAVVWLLFAPIYLLGWVHRHPRRDAAATGWSGSAALATLMYLLNILAFGLLTILFTPAPSVRFALC